MLLRSCRLLVLLFLPIYSLVVASVSPTTDDPSRIMTCDKPGPPIQSIAPEIKEDQRYNFQSHKKNSISCFLVFLEDSEAQFDSVYDYIKLNTRGCNSLGDKISIVTPSCAHNPNQYSCKVYGQTLMDSWNYTAFQPPDNTNNTGHMQEMLYRALDIMRNDQNQGRSSFTIITDMKCDEFCGSSLPDLFYTTLGFFGESGYMLQLYFTRNGFTNHDQCADFFEMTGLTPVFGTIPQINANNICYPKFSNTDHCNYTSDKVNFGGASEPKSSSKLILAGYFLQYWPMQSYQNFLRLVTTDCGANDKIELINYSISSEGEKNLTQAELDYIIRKTSSSYFIEMDPGQYDVAIISLTTAILNASIESSPDRNNYIYLFMDIDCNLLCSFNNNATLYFVNTIKECYENGFMIRIFQMPKLSAHCDGFSNYWASTGLPEIQTIPVNQSDIDMYSICAWKEILETTTILEPTKSETKETTVLITSTVTHWTSSNSPFVKNDKFKTWLVIVITGISLLFVIVIIVGLIWWQKNLSRNVGVSNLRSTLSNKKDDDKYNDEVWQLAPEQLFLKESELLGRGAFGCVYKGSFRVSIPSLREQKKLRMPVFQSADGSYQAAVKRLPPRATEFQRQELFQEIEFMKKLGYHTHIIAYVVVLFSMSLTASNRMFGYIALPDDPMLLLEYCENGDLRNYLQKLRTSNRDDVNSKEFISISWQILDGLCYLHANNFVHRDIAARNILLTGNMTAKISDFGLCRQSDSAQYTAKGGKLPIRWMAIESLRFMEFSAKSDMWSFGVTVWEILSLGESPFMNISGEELPQFLEDGNRLEFPIGCPPEIVSLIVTCWNKSPENRPTSNKLRDQLGAVLDETSLHYGYLNFESCAENTSTEQQQVV